MGKLVSITVTVVIEAEVPKSWNEDNIEEKVGSALEWAFKSSKKSLVIGDETESTVEVEIYDEEE